MTILYNYAKNNALGESLIKITILFFIRDYRDNSPFCQIYSGQLNLKQKLNFQKDFHLSHY